MSLCGACNLSIAEDDAIVCRTCKQVYHQACGSLLSGDSRRTRLSSKEWLCTICTAKRKLFSGNANSPSNKSPGNHGSQDKGVHTEDKTSRDPNMAQSIEPGMGVSSTDINKLAELLNQKLQVQFESKLSDMLDRKFSTYKKELLLGLEERLKSCEAAFEKITKKQEELTQAVKFVSDSHDEIKQEIEQLKIKQRSFDILEKHTKDLQSQVGEINTRFYESQRYIEDLEQQLFEKDCEIRGLSYDSEKDASALVRKIKEKLQCELTEADVSDVHWGPPPQRRSRSSTAYSAELASQRSIIISFTKTSSRNKFLNAAKAYNISASKTGRNKLNVADLEHSGDGGKYIYISERLTGKRKRLLSLTKIAAREKQYKYVWVRAGKICVRKDTGGTAIIVSFEAQLANL